MLFWVVTSCSLVELYEHTGHTTEISVHWCQTTWYYIPKEHNLYRTSNIISFLYLLDYFAL